MSTIAVDISEFQIPVTDAYPHEWLIFRACDGTYVDRNAARNLAWAKQAATSGKIAGYTVYCVYRPGTATLATVMRTVGKPDPHVTVMIDVESWSGAIRGDHSQQITALANGLASWLGDRRRVLVYGNQNDLATIYPDRPAWLRLVVASYGSVQPRVANMIGWQYSDGQRQWATASGLPRTSKPFGACDHNIFPGLTAAELAATLGVGDDMPLTDTDVQKVADAVWAKRFADPNNPQNSYRASSWLVYSNLRATAALAQATAAATAAKAAQAVVDTAAVAQDIKNRVITLLGGHS